MRHSGVLPILSTLLLPAVMTVAGAETSQPAGRDANRPAPEAGEAALVPLQADNPIPVSQNGPRELCVKGDDCYFNDNITIWSNCGNGEPLGTVCGQERVCSERPSCGYRDYVCTEVTVDGATARACLPA